MLEAVRWIIDFSGDVTVGELGCAAIPGKEKQFRESIRVTVEYAKALGVKKLVGQFVLSFVVVRVLVL